MKPLLALALALACCSAQQCPAHPLTEQDSSQSAWLTLWTSDRQASQYIQLWSDGTLLTRNEAKNSALTRAGTADKALAAGFFKALKGASQFEDTKTRFQREYFGRHEVAEVSAYRYGELRYAQFPLGETGRQLRQQLAALKKAADSLPPWRQLRLFIAAYPLSEDYVSIEEQRIGRAIKFSVLETAVLEEFAPLADAVYKPRQLLPLETQAQENRLLDFIAKHKIKNFGDKFYLDTPRGKFRIDILPPAK